MPSPILDVLPTDPARSGDTPAVSFEPPAAAVASKRDAGPPTNAEPPGVGGEEMSRSWKEADGGV